MTRSSSVRRALPACLTGKSDAITGVRRWAPLAATLALGLLAAACEPGASSATARASGAGGAGGASTACKPGEFRCTGDVLEHCSEDGKAFAKVVTCPVPGLCDAVGGQCDVCSSTAATCQDATTLDRCSADGQKNTPVACTGKTPYCAPTKAGDSCVECTKATDCVSSASECELAVCSADGVCAGWAERRMRCQGSVHLLRTRPGKVRGIGSEHLRRKGAVEGRRALQWRGPDLPFGRLRRVRSCGRLPELGQRVPGPLVLGQELLRLHAESARDALRRRRRDVRRCGAV